MDICISQLSRMPHCISVAVLEPICFKFAPTTVDVSDVRDVSRDFLCTRPMAQWLDESMLLAVAVCQDPEASYDVNDDDTDPQPRYEYTNENRSLCCRCCFVPLLCVQDIRLFMKLFKTNNIDIVNYCQYCFGFEMPSELWAKRISKLNQKIANCSNL